LYANKYVSAELLPHNAALAAAFLYKGLAVNALRNLRVSFVCSDFDGFECAVMFVAHIELAGCYVAMDTWILIHGYNSPF